MKNRLLLTTIIICLISGCSTAPKGEHKKSMLNGEVDLALSEFKSRSPSVKVYVADAYGYAVFPKIIKGAFWVGGAFGRGQVYEKSQMVGFSSISQATFGLSFGGEFFRELIFFRDRATLERFKTSNFVFSAQATAVVAEAGIGAKTDYKDGMAVFIITEAGLMVDASIGGQKFRYVPK